MSLKLAAGSVQAIEDYRRRRSLPESARTQQGDLHVMAGGIRLTMQAGPNALVLLHARVGALPRDPAAFAHTVQRVGMFAAGLMVASPASCIIDATGYGLRLWQSVRADGADEDFDKKVRLFTQTCLTWRETLTVLER